jgi:hypothetical protein
VKSLSRRSATPYEKRQQSSMADSHSAPVLSSSQRLPFQLGALRQYVFLALTYPAATYTLAALLYRVSPSAPILIDGDEYVIRANLHIPISRLISGKTATSVDQRTLDQSFSAYAFAMGSPCTIMGLLRACDSISSITGIGRVARNAIAHGDRGVSRTAIIAEADKADVLLLLSAGGAVGQRYAEAAETLFDIQRSGANVESRLYWVAKVLRALSWSICPSVVLEILDRMFDPAKTSSARDRFEARTRIAFALTYA